MKTFKLASLQRAGNKSDFGVRRPGAALLSIAPNQDKSGARPPHSKEGLDALGA